jgi:hypothetical protein
MLATFSRILIGLAVWGISPFSTTNENGGSSTRGASLSGHDYDERHHGRRHVGRNAASYIFREQFRG